MKLRRLIMGTMIAVLACAAIGCTKNKADAEKTTAESQQDAGESKAEGESEEEEELVKPESYGTVTLGEYKNLSIEVTDSNVTDAEVEEQITQALSFNPDSTEITGRPVKDGDIVNINYKGLLDGEAFDGGTADNQDLVIGSGSFIPGFEEGVIGMNIGDEKNLDVTFPEDYHAENLKGKAVVFEVKLNSIKEEKPAELTDAWVEKTTGGESKTVDEYRATTRKNLEEAKKASSESEARSLAMEQVMTASTYELNPEAVDYEFKKIKNQYKKQLEQYGMTMESIAEQSGKTVEEFEEELKMPAEREVKRVLVLNAILEKEGISIGEEDYKKLAEVAGQPEATQSELELQFGKDVIEMAVKDFKITTFLVENGTVSVRPVETQAETAAAESEKEKSSEGN